MTGEPDAPTLVPNIDGQRLLRQFNTVHRALALARGRDRRTAGGDRTARHARGGLTGVAQPTRLLSRARASPANGLRVGGLAARSSNLWAAASGDAVRIDAPDGTWAAIVVSVE